MYFKKSDIFGLVGFSRSFLLLVLGSMCAHRLLFLALVLNSLSYAFYFKGDVNVIFLRALVKVIFLFQAVKRFVFSYKLYKKRFAVFSL